MKRLICLLLFAVIAADVRPARAFHANSERLCSDIVASLTPYLGDPSQTRAGQRVEVRQCPLNAEIGTIQIVAWAAGAAEPGIVVDTELRTLRQMAMVPGAYALEIASASGASIIGIVFENGKPRQTLRDSSKGTIRFKSDGKSIIVELNDENGSRRSHILRGEFTRK